VKQAAIELGLDIFQPVSLKLRGEIERLASLKPDLIVVAAFGQILPPAILQIPPYGSLNIHPSLLPRYRGASPIPAAILAGDEFTGVSIMKMDKGLDTGPVMTRAQIHITGHDTTGSISEKLSFIAADLVQDVIVHLVRGELKPLCQNEKEATYSSPIQKKDGEINWTEQSITIWRKIRAFHPWPGTFTTWKGKRLEILQGFPLPWPQQKQVGNVIDLMKITDEAGFGISTGDGLLGVCHVRLEGKREVTARDFLNGQHNFMGSTLPS
jgi:methionyl-tRNA formyltransferase